MAPSRVARALGLALVLAAQAAAQCCMFCPNGAGVDDAFDSNARASAHANADADAHVAQATAAMRRGGGGVLAKSQSGGSVIVYQAQVDFNVPALPSAPNGSLTSTLYSGMASNWGADTYNALAMLTFDPAYGSAGSWAVQPVIQKNGQVVAAGTKYYTSNPGHTVTSTISQPFAAQSFIEITMADPFNGVSVANFGGFYGAADSNTWHVGWGWSDTAADCTVFPPGGSVEMNNILASDSNGEPVGLDFSNQNSLQPFCGLTAQSSYSQSQAAVTFTYDDGLGRGLGRGASASQTP